MEFTPHLRHCEDLWFNDGTIVLQAGNTLFRVYSGILARHSPFFENLFTLPQPQDAETYEGCPLVQLVGDSAEDVHDFLLALHDFDYPQALLNDAFCISALLLLSAKYETHNLRRKVIALLLPTFPTTLPAYNSLIEKAKNDKSFRPPFKTVPELVALANAFQIASPILLPYALLKMQRIADADLTYITDGVQGRGTRIYLADDLQRCVLRGRPALTRACRTIVIPNIFVPAQCVEGFCDTEKINYMSKHIRADGYMDPLLQRSFKHFCRDCKEVLDTEAKAGRLNVWTQLPELFGLPPWEALEGSTADR